MRRIVLFDAIPALTLGGGSTSTAPRKPRDF
jgi:hypothetical protein